MRDRLIELLKQIDFDYGEECVCASEDGYKGAPDLAEFFADRLLAEGVIVPPCNVGQTVYIIGWDDNIEEFTVKDIAYEEGNFGAYFYRFRAVMGEEIDIHFTNNNIGTRVFLTREEAEKALERRENGT